MDKNIKIKTEDGAVLTIKMKDGVDGVQGKDGKDGKDIDIKPIIDSITALKKELKKTPTSNNKEILDALKLINTKSDNSDIIKAIESMSNKILVPEGNKELVLRFDKFVDALNNQGLFRASYNSYDPKIRNSEGTEINPATEETLQSIAGLSIPKHDTRELGYTDGNLTTVTYKLLGVTVALKTLTYTDGNLSSVVVS